MQKKVTGKQIEARLADLVDVDGTTPTAGQVLAYDGAEWIPTAAASGDLFMFQVGVPSAQHIHWAVMTAEQAKVLVFGTNGALPVGAVGQPFIVLTTVPNAQPSEPNHTHDITVYFDYITHTFVVTNITNNALDNHTAHLIGDGVGAGGTSLTLTEDIDFSVPIDATFRLWSGLDSLYYATYNAEETGYLQPLNGDFDPLLSTSGPPGPFGSPISFPAAQHVKFEGGLSSEGITASANTDTDTWISAEFEVLEIPAPFTGKQFFVGIYDQSIGTYDPDSPTTSRHAYWYQQGGIGNSFGYNYGGATSAPLPAWQVGDRLGLTYLRSSAQLKLFHNGTLMAVLNTPLPNTFGQTRFIAGYETLS